MGVPVLNGRGRGDQVVTIRVEVPRSMNDAQKEALKKFAEAMGEDIPEEKAGCFDNLKDKINDKFKNKN